MSKKLLIIAGASCSGKTSLANELIKRDRFVQTKQYTTRERRPKEGDDEYIFVNYDKFLELENSRTIDAKFSISETWKYGISFDLLSEDKINVIAVISPSYIRDIYRAAEKAGIDCELVHIKVPTSIRVQRMRDKGETEESIATRLDIERREGSSLMIECPPDKILEISDYTLSVEELADIVEKRVFSKKEC